MDREKSKKIIPKHIGIVMDGNRSWAHERNLKIHDGHLNGYEKMRKSFDWFFSCGVEIISFFVFSSSDWERDRNEVNDIMKLLKKFLDRDLEEYNEKGFKILFSGRILELPGDLPETIKEVEAKTRVNKKGIVNFCLNYGGRSEIIDAIKKIMEKKIDANQIHEGIFRKYLYHGDLADLDLVIRNGGKQEFSGLLLWQSINCEAVFLKKDWPDFEEDDVKNILEEYNFKKQKIYI